MIHFFEMFGCTDLLGPIEKISQLKQFFPGNVVNRWKFSLNFGSLDGIKIDRPKKISHGR